MTTSTADIPTPDPAVAAAALRLAQAEAAASAAETALAEAGAERDRVRARITDLDGERHSIGMRRQRGDARDGDGAQLALIAADIEALGTILGEKDATVAAATAVAERARNALNTARHGFTREQDLREEAALVERLAALDALMLAAIDQANACARRLGRGVAEWSPSERTMEELTRLDLTRKTRNWATFRA